MSSPDARAARDALVDRVAREIHSETCTGRPCGSCPRLEDLAAARAVLDLLEAEGLLTQDMGGVS
jgi:hypothetical protein